MATYDIYVWGPLVLISAYLAFLFYRYLLKKTIAKKIVLWGIGGYVILMLVRIGIGALLTHRAWEASESYQKYYTLEYSNHIWELVWQACIHLGLNLLYGAVVFIIFWGIFKLTKGLVIDTTDALLLGFGTAIAGWPKITIVIALVFALTILWKIARVSFRKDTFSSRILITPHIPLAIIIVIYAGDYLSRITGMYALR